MEPGAKTAFDWRPYWELMRIKLFTTIIMSSPYLYGALYSACTSQQVLLPQLLWIEGKLLLSALLSHTWACTWNDVVDCELDRQVERCRNRPIARGAVTRMEGFVFTILQLCVWLLYHRYFLPEYNVWGILAAVMAILYPYAKRVTNYTPVVLGIIFAWGTLLGSVAVGGDPHEIAQFTPRSLGLVALSGYTLVWVINFETIYAFQDIQDDVKAGIKSMAIQYRRNAKVIFGQCIVAQMILLAFSGVAMDASWIYYAIVPVANTWLQFRTQLQIDLTKPDECTAFFKRVPATSALIGIGLFYEYLST